MSAGWIERFAVGAALATLGGCEVITPEQPPPPSRYEVVPAPPQARGARAAGTDAAPKLPNLLEPEGEPDAEEETPESPDGADAGAQPGTGVAL